LVDRQGDALVFCLALLGLSIDMMLSYLFPRLQFAIGFIVFPDVDEK
jgi:hypothetical protein